MKQPGAFRLGIERLFARFGLGMRAKLITIFVFIKVLPLVLLALVAWRQAWNLGEEVRVRAMDLSRTALTALEDTGDLASMDAGEALDDRARDDIERISTDTAKLVADFLYRRDGDVLLAAQLKPDQNLYRSFVQNRRGRIIRQGSWKLAEDQSRWVPDSSAQWHRQIESSIESNAAKFHYRKPDNFQYEDRPLFLEMTFVDLNGRERLKVTTSDLMSKELKDVSRRENTFVRAEDYFKHLAKLQPGEIYVSDVIGEYVGSRIIGMYNPANAAKAGIPFDPQNSAYAGKENPLGRRFRGLVRWATPVMEGGKKTGYVTLALDHDHIMEFTAHILPTGERYTEIPDAYGGNYAFIWDYKGRSIVHPRHFSITGYDAATGDPQVPWLEDRIYEEWKASGLSYAEFIDDVPVFVDQNRDKKLAGELTRQGLVGLDCRYLNNAPQCTGWFDLTKGGGSGSFNILWSGLWKLNTAATIPYYTGHYGNSLRGFGFVAIGAELEVFHQPAKLMEQKIDALFDETDDKMSAYTADTQAAIRNNLFDTATSLAVSTFAMAALVICVAIWMASAFTRSITSLIDGISRFRSGERHFRFNAVIKDEIGTLADSFDEMADSLVASVHGGLTITDLNSRIIYMNEDRLKLIHKTLDEVLGQPYWSCSISGAGGVNDPIAALQTGVEPESFHHEETGRYFLSRADYFTSKDGEHIGYIITISDVTEMAKEQQRTAQQHALLDNIFNTSPDLISLQDINGNFTVVNDRFASIAGLAPGRIVGRNAGEIMNASLCESNMNMLRYVSESGSQMKVEDRMCFADGHVETLESVHTPLVDGSGRVNSVLSVSRDVSFRVEVEERLIKTQKELEKAVENAIQASAAKSAFLARMSHEIRTPMNAILGMTGIARRKLHQRNFDQGEVGEHLAQIEQSSKHLLGIISDILDISKIEAGKIELDDEFFRLDSLISEVASIIRPRCTEKNIQFVINQDQLDSYAFHGDPLRLRQVLINLLGNAVKFTGFSGVVTLELRLLEKAENAVRVHFAVSDTGIGLDKSKFKSLFNPFEQANQGITRKYGGTGLGLSISQSIIKMMGGEIKVESEEGRGSTFYFDLRLEQDENQLAETVKSAGDVGFLEGKRILLVDDVDINRMIVVEMLFDAKVTIDEAEDGQDALEIFRKSEPGHYDLVLMDIQMPVMDGYAACTAIRRLDRSDAAAVPIIAMTANAFKDDVDKAFACGMNAHVSKPVEYSALLDAMIYVLESKAT
ncbi:MAG: response regulator [Deltaproteobacteria bacterium]|jgi:PAS domain S-box-containing protein|nr:response regulator [Deltaproteobacteria bacterium]